MHSFWFVSFFFSFLLFLLVIALPPQPMPTYSSDLKHHILSQYRPYSPHHSFHALALSVGGGLSASTISDWYSRWDGTPQSLERKAGSGRPRIMTRAQMAQQILPRVRSANRRHEAVHYTTIKPAVERAIGKSISLRTIQRYGKKILHIKDKKTKKRTAVERRYSLMVY
jgi:transposase